MLRATRSRVLSRARIEDLAHEDEAWAVIVYDQLVVIVMGKAASRRLPLGKE